jgi:hypothetical protein
LQGETLVAGVFSGPRDRGLVLVCALAASVALGACGSSDSPDASTAGRYVTESNLEHFKPGTPQLTTLSWWRAVQFGNTALVGDFYAPGAAPEQTDLARELTAASSQFVGVPKFNSADVQGSRATLYFFLGRPGSTSPPRPLSVNLTRVGQEWKLADNSLLESQVARVAKLLREADEES